MKLFHKEFGSGKPLVILHGLFGFSDNWQSHAKSLSSYYRVILFDLRNHGRSPWDDNHAYEDMALDVAESLDQLSVDKACFIGHSMGGKVLMHLGLNHGSYIDKMIVVDMGTKSYPMHHQDVIHAIQSVNIESVTARSQVNEMLKPILASEGLRQFLLKNLYWKEKGVLAWRMNVKTLVKNMEEVLSALPDGEILNESLFIRGGLSNYILDDDVDLIQNQFPNSELLTIDGAGHWVHAEASEAFLEATLSFLLR
ncbi:MAG: alpha/beta fold hydrolase [Flavobacteriales bacterium]|jgi:esterase|nr:alpha/beta fold hydrolase [Flavobacteriales bacterium]MDC0459466.1 alpha/beta fold hydrolase [Crocinitomicaceae bacterium]